MGELAMSERRFNDAVGYYKQAIALEPNNSANYYKLYRVHNRMHNYENALDDLSSALEHEPSKLEYREQRGKLLVALGQCDRAMSEYEAFPGLPASDIAKAKECSEEISIAQDAYQKGDYESAVLWFDRALQKVEQADDLLYMKALASYELKDYYGVVSATAKIIKNHSSHYDAYRLRGDAYFRLGENDMAVTHYREVLKLDPEHKACKAAHKRTRALMKKDKRANSAREEGNHHLAIELWIQGIDLDPTHTAYAYPTILKIAEAHTDLKQHEAALDACDRYIKLTGETAVGYIALGDAQLAAEKYQESVRSYHKASELAPDDMNQTIREKIKKAEVALKQSKTKNYYKILSIPRNAQKKEIKKAYRELALKWHPDKNTDNEEEAKLKFQDISEAYEVLSNEEMRGKYDRGEDVFENQGGGSNPHQQWQNHFSRGGGGGGGGQRFSFHMG